jgi:hypothetical protein
LSLGCGCISQEYIQRRNEAAVEAAGKWPRILWAVHTWKGGPICLE